MADRKRVVFCTYSSLYSSIVLKQLIEDDDIEVVAIVNSTRVHHPQFGQFRGALKQIQLSGWHYSTYLFLVTDFFSWLQPWRTLRNSTLQTVHALAAHNNIPVLDTRDINELASRQFFTRLKPDYLLAAHFNQLVKKDILEMGTLECLNIHPSTLPSYQGVDPVFYAMLNEEKEIGVSLHRMSVSFDKGEVLAQSYLNAHSFESVCAGNKKLFKLGANLALDWMKQKSQLTAKQSEMEEHYDSWPQPELVSQFIQSGKRLIGLTDLFQE